MPLEIDRHLILLGLFYSSSNKTGIGEGLFRKVLDKYMQDQSSDSVNYNLMMALNFYGRLLLQNPKRQTEAHNYLKQSELLA
jgi:hypothetical protein